MSKEAMKLALEALETAWTYDEDNADGYYLEAITALREALANEALDKMAENARELGLDYEPARDSGIVTAGGADPRTQRPWQGLTDEEIEQGCKESWVTEQAWQSAVWWAEAKLMEKNNG